MLLSIRDDGESHNELPASLLEKLYCPAISALPDS